MTVDNVQVKYDLMIIGTDGWWSDVVGILDVDNIFVITDNGVRVVDDRKKFGTLLNGRWVSGDCQDDVRVEDD